MNTHRHRSKLSLSDNEKRDTKERYKRDLRYRRVSMEKETYKREIQQRPTKERYKRETQKRDTKERYKREIQNRPTI